MIEFLIEGIAFIFSEGVLSASDKRTSKSKKIYHGIFRTIIYLFFVGLFIFLALTIEEIHPLLTIGLAIIFFLLMVVTNWKSFKRHQEWVLSQED